MYATQLVYAGWALKLEVLNIRVHNCKKYTSCRFRSIYQVSLRNAPKNVKSFIKVTYIPTMFEMFRFDNTQIVSAVYIVIVLIW